MLNIVVSLLGPDPVTRHPAVHTDSGTDQTFLFRNNENDYMTIMTTTKIKTRWSDTKTKAQECKRNARVCNHCTKEFKV